MKGASCSWQLRSPSASRASLLALALVALLWLLLARTVVSAPAFLYQITVSTPLDEYDVSGSGTGCALREAIQTANLGTDFGGCVRIATVLPFIRR